MAAVNDVATELNLTIAEQDALELPRLVPGNLVRWRFSVRDAEGVAIDLTGWDLILTCRASELDDTILWQRRVGEVITGSYNEITLDGGQASPEVNPTSSNPTGRSWITVLWHPTEEEALRASAGRRRYDLTGQPPNEESMLLLIGDLEIPLNVTRASQFA